VVTLKFNGKRLLGCPRIICVSQVLEDIKMGGKSWQEIKRRNCGMKEDTADI
jgi:hypothetical protein